MRSVIFALFFLAAATVHALPVVPGATGGLEDLIAAEQQLSINPLEIIVSLLRGLLAADQPRSLAGGEGINPYQLLSLANSFLTNLAPRNALADNNVRDESSQDPRVLNYEQEINRRNQIGRLARVFTSFLFR